MAACHVARNGETQADAAGGRIARSLEAEEGFENVFVMRRSTLEISARPSAPAAASGNML
jgi:hypothetical protein